MAVFDRRVKHKNGTVSVMRYIRWYLPGGKAVTRSLGPAHSITKTEAKEILAEKSGKDKKKKRHGQLLYEDPVFSEYISIYIRYARDIEKKRSWKRDVSTLNNLENSLGGKLLSEITSRDINKYREQRIADGVTPRTVNLEMSCLSQLYKLAKQNGNFIGEIPLSNIKQFEIQNNTDRILSFYEERKLIDASAPHLKAIIICALNTGMRRGEIISLRWDKINMDHGYILLEATNTKSKRQRKVPINSIMRELFQELKAKSKSEYVFVNSSGDSYMDADGIRKSFASAKKKAGIEKFRFHDLRHTAATRMIESGVPLFTVGQILGHTDPKTTMRYAHPDESLKEGIEALARYNRNSYSNSGGKDDGNNDVSNCNH